tara:strand:- start:1509 stop:1640 length:132 start_codon:yes stop_codon:yes gene_type:complete
MSNIVSIAYYREKALQKKEESQRQLLKLIREYKRMINNETIKR